MGDVVIDVPPESQVHKQVIRKSATDRCDRDGTRPPARFTSRWPSPTCTSLRAISNGWAGAEDQWQIEGVEADLTLLRRLQPVLRKGEWKVTVV